MDPIVVDGLFRQEALDARRATWHGGISLALPLSYRLMAWSAALFGIAVIFFLAFGTYTRRSTVTGRLVPTQGMALIEAPVAGVIRSVDAKEGDSLVEGNSIAVLTIPRSTPSLGDANAVIRASFEQRIEGIEASFDAQRALHRTQYAALNSQIAAALTELQEITAQEETRQKQIDLSKEALDRYKRLDGSGFVSQLQIKQQESSMLEYQAQQQSLRRDAAALRRTILQLRQNLMGLPAAVASAEATNSSDRALVLKEQAIAQTEEILSITAPINGVVASQTLKIGQSIKAGQTISTLLPINARLEARLAVPSRSIGFVRPGDTVLLRYESFPYQKFGHQPGLITAVSRSPLADWEKEELGLDAKSTESMYRIDVALRSQTINAYGRAEGLKAGMVLKADILGESRSLMEWLFEPLYSLKVSART